MQYRFERFRHHGLQGNALDRQAQAGLGCHLAAVSGHAQGDTPGTDKAAICFHCQNAAVVGPESAYFALLDDVYAGRGGSPGECPVNCIVPGNSCPMMAAVSEARGRELA